MPTAPLDPEAKRLEALWRGKFGDVYNQRNDAVHLGRQPFWEDVLAEFRVRRVLEVGCNNGGNLRWITRALRPDGVVGIDINFGALKALRRNVPGAQALWGRAQQLPFRDGSFDLVLTVGVLIHQPPAALPAAMAEIVRCSRRYILCGEYFSPVPTSVPYRGQPGALFKRNFEVLYQQLFPSLALRKQGFLPRKEGGWDDITYWIFEKQNA